MTRRADVVVPVHSNVELTRACLSSVLENCGESLAKLIVVDDCGPDPAMRPMLRALRDSDARVRLLENEENRGFVSSVNRGLSVRGGDAVILNSDAEVTPGWLDELLEVLHGNERIAAATPLSNNATLASVPTYGVGSPVERLRGVELELTGLPRWTEVPTGVGFCMAMRDELLSLVGLFDPAYGRGYNEENDWCQRARALGFLVVRANRCLVFHHGEASFQGARAALDEHNARRLVQRYPGYLEDNRDFERGPQARVAAIGVRAQVAPLRVCLDLCHLIAPDIHGTAVYGVQLARALARRPEVELSVAVSAERVGAALADARIACISPEAAQVGFDVVHKPTQVYDVPSLGRLLRAEGHLVFTWQDLIALRSPPALGNVARTHELRSLTWAALSAAQGVIAISETARGELLDFMPELEGRIARVPLGVDALTPSSADLEAVASKYALPAKYVVHAGSDYPHKNLEFLLEAWPLVGLEDVELVLAGPPSRLPRALFGAPARLPPRARYLGELPSAEVLPVIAGASVAVFPSVYEGFGLGVLEAMAVGVPTVISGFSAMAEVAGDAAAVPGNKTPAGFADTLRAVLADAPLAERLRRAGLERAREYSWDETARQTVQHYSRVASSPSGQSLAARDALRRLLTSP